MKNPNLNLYSFKKILFLVLLSMLILETIYSLETKIQLKKNHLNKLHKTHLNSYSLNRNNDDVKVKVNNSPVECAEVKQDVVVPFTVPTDPSNEQSKLVLTSNDTPIYEQNYPFSEDTKSVYKHLLDSQNPKIQVESEISPHIVDNTPSTDSFRRNYDRGCRGRKNRCNIIRKKRYTGRHGKCDDVCDIDRGCARHGKCDDVCDIDRGCARYGRCDDACADREYARYGRCNDVCDIDGGCTRYGKCDDVCDIDRGCTRHGRCDDACADRGCARKKSCHYSHHAHKSCKKLGGCNDSYNKHRGHGRCK